MIPQTTDIWELVLLIRTYPVNTLYSSSNGHFRSLSNGRFWVTQIFTAIVTLADSYVHWRNADSYVRWRKHRKNYRKNLLAGQFHKSHIISKTRLQISYWKIFRWSNIKNWVFSGRFLCPSFLFAAFLQFPFKFTDLCYLCELVCFLSHLFGLRSALAFFITSCMCGSLLLYSWSHINTNLLSFQSVSLRRLSLAWRRLYLASSFRRRWWRGTFWYSCFGTDGSRFFWFHGTKKIFKYY